MTAREPPISDLHVPATGSHGSPSTRLALVVGYPCTAVAKRLRSEARGLGGGWSPDASSSPRDPGCDTPPFRSRTSGYTRAEVDGAMRFGVRRATRVCRCGATGSPGVLGAPIESAVSVVSDQPRRSVATLTVGFCGGSRNHAVRPRALGAGAVAGRLRTAGNSELLARAQLEQSAVLVQLLRHARGL